MDIFRTARPQSVVCAFLSTERKSLDLESAPLLAVTLSRPWAQVTYSVSTGLFCYWQPPPPPRLLSLLPPARRVFCAPKPRFVEVRLDMSACPFLFISACNKIVCSVKDFFSPSMNTRFDRGPPRLFFLKSFFPPPHLYSAGPVFDLCGSRTWLSPLPFCTACCFASSQQNPVQSVSMPFLFYQPAPFLHFRLNRAFCHH